MIYANETRRFPNRHETLVVKEYADSAPQHGNAAAMHFRLCIEMDMSDILSEWGMQRRDFHTKSSVMYRLRLKARAVMRRVTGARRVCSVPSALCDWSVSYLKTCARNVQCVLYV